MEALDLDFVEQWHDWDSDRRRSSFEERFGNLTGAERNQCVEALPEQIRAIEEALKNRIEGVRSIRRLDRTESDAERLDEDRQLLGELREILSTARLVDQQLDLLTIEASGGAASFAGYSLEGETYNINFPTTPFGDSPGSMPGAEVPAPDSDPFGTPSPEEGIPEDPLNDPTVEIPRDGDGNGIADQDFNQDGVINHDDLIPPKALDMLEKPHVMLAIKEGDLVDVAGWNPDTKVLQLKVYNAEGNFAYVNINGIDPANFALLFDGGVSEQNLETYRNVPTELLCDFYWRDSTESFAERLGLAPETLPADRLAAIPKHAEVMASLESLDFLPFTGDVPMEPLHAAVDKIFNLFNTNQLLSEQVQANIHQIVVDTESLGDEAQAQLFTALPILLKMHLDEATFASVMGPAVLEIEANINPTGNSVDLNQNQILAIMALETAAPGNFGGAEMLLHKLFSQGMGTVGEFSGERGAEAIRLAKEFAATPAATTSNYFPGLDQALANEEELEAMGGIVEITDELIDGLSVLAHTAAATFAAAPESGTDAQAVDAGLMTLINSIKALGPRAAASDIRTKIIDTALTFPSEAQDDIMAAFLTLTHENFPDFFGRLTSDDQFIANSWSIVDNGDEKPLNYEEIMGWLQTAAIEHAEELDVEIPPDDPSSNTIESGKAGWDLGYAIGSNKWLNMFAMDTYVWNFIGHTFNVDGLGRKMHGWMTAVPFAILGGVRGVMLDLRDEIADGAGELWDWATDW